MAVVIDWDLTEPPQRIDQVAAFRPGQVPTAAEINEYINLLISQGNYNTAWLVMIAEKLTNSLVADINTQLGQITIDLETMYGTQTAEMQAIVAQIDAAADQAVLDMKAAVAATDYAAVDTKIILHQNSLVLSTNGVHGLRYTLPAEVGGDGLLEAYNPTTSTWTTIETSGAQVSNIAIFVDRDNWVITTDGDYTNTILVDGMLDICFPDWALLPANMKTYSEAERAVRRLLRNLETYDGGIILHATSAPVNSFTILVKDDAASGSDVIANYAEMIGRISALETEVNSNGVAHNGIYRGKNLTNVYTNAQLSAMIQDGTFKDIYIGDYIEKTITTSLGGTEKVRLVFAGFDTFLHNGATDVTSHHAVMVPEDCFKTTAQMNATNVTTGGYLGSVMHTNVLPVYYAALNAALDSHILTHSRLLSNSVATSGTSMAGAGLVGYANNWTWADVNLCLMSEIMLYGSTVCSSSFYDTGDACLQLPLFALNPEMKRAYLGCDSGSRYNFWLCAVASSPFFAYCSDNGGANSTGASYSHGVRPYFLFT